MAVLNISPPWVRLYREIKELFSKDPEVFVLYDDFDGYKIKIYVDDFVKGSALERVMPKSKTYGNVSVDIIVIPGNKNNMGVSLKEELTLCDLFELAFGDNEAVVDIIDVATPIGKISYIVFVKEVVQYFCDDIGDIDGKCSTLYEAIAKDVFESHNGIFFCTSSIG